MIEDPAGRSRHRPLPPGIATIPFFQPGWPKPGQGPLRFPDLPSRYPFPTQGRCASPAPAVAWEPTGEYLNPKKIMMINATDPEEIRVATLIDGVLFDYDVEFLHNEKIKGNLYKAKVVRADTSLQAAFVHFGGQKNGFLPLGELPRDMSERPPWPHPGRPPAGPGDPRPGRARGAGLQGRHDDRPDQPGGPLPGHHPRQSRERHQPQDRGHARSVATSSSSSTPWTSPRTSA